MKSLHVVIFVCFSGTYGKKNGRGEGIFNVAIKKLEKADAGKYRCGVEKTLNVLYQEINFIVVDVSTLPGFPTSATTIPQNKTALLSQDSFTSSTEQSPAASSPSDGKRSKEASRFTDTTMVIIVSGSLALLVCSIIPIIFYGHWRSTAGVPNRAEFIYSQGDHCEENANVESAQVEVGLQAFESDNAPETDADTSQYAAIYQALDHQTLD